MSRKTSRNPGMLVYSTDPSWRAGDGEQREPESLPPAHQNLTVWVEKKHRRGKPVTLVRGFVGSAGDLRALGRHLRSKCGVGGSVKGGEILVQGDCREKVLEILKDLGYRVKRAGG
ncbi:MAG: translation initiation factor [Calditrichaeota bacterium]|nr:MAG: translation initiation factor [Calditrichota bacterium]